MAPSVAPFLLRYLCNNALYPGCDVHEYTREDDVRNQKKQGESRAGFALSEHAYLFLASSPLLYIGFSRFNPLYTRMQDINRQDEVKYSRKVERRRRRITYLRSALTAAHEKVRVK